MENCGDSASTVSAPATPASRSAAYPPMLDPYATTRPYPAVAARTRPMAPSISGYWYQSLSRDSTCTASIPASRSTFSSNPGLSSERRSVNESNVTTQQARSTPPGTRRTSRSRLRNSSSIAAYRNTSRRDRKKLAPSPATAPAANASTGNARHVALAVTSVKYTPRLNTNPDRFTAMNRTHCRHTGPPPCPLNVHIRLNHHVHVDAATYDATAPPYSPSPPFTAYSTAVSTISPLVPTAANRRNAAAVARCPAARPRTVTAAPPPAAAGR